MTIETPFYSEHVLSVNFCNYIHNIFFLSSGYKVEVSRRAISFCSLVSMLLSVMFASAVRIEKVIRGMFLVPARVKQQKSPVEILEFIP